MLLQLTVMNIGNHFAKVLRDPEWMRDPAFDSVAGRLKAHDQIDSYLSEWTRSRTPQAAMNDLCAHGVPAGAVQCSRDLAQDPQYAHREFHKFHDHPEMGSVPYAGNQFRIPGYKAGPYSYAPLLGEHSRSVMRDVLKMSDDEIAKAITAGALK